VDFLVNAKSSSPMINPRRVSHGVYSHAGSLRSVIQTNTQRCFATFCGPLVVNTLTVLAIFPQREFTIFSRDLFQTEYF